MVAKLLRERLLTDAEPDGWHWMRVFAAVHPSDPQNLERSVRSVRFMRLCGAGAWLDAAMSLLPQDRAVRMHRYRGRRSGWCCVSKAMALPELEIIHRDPSDIQFGTEFFTMCALFECAVLIVALKCAGKWP